jgi:TnpA family transposase
MDLIRSLRTGSRLTSLGAALAELGRLQKTLHNLAFIAKDETYRRGILTALNHGETRNKLARTASWWFSRGDLL